MGLILDSSLLIADERGKFDMAGFLRQFPGSEPPSNRGTGETGFN
jgi:hypothetical protein